MPKSSPTAALRPEGFAIHPASLDSALHALAATSEGDTPKRLPFAWREVSLPPAGDGGLRVQISGDAAGELALPDRRRRGHPLGRARLALREFDPAVFGAARQAAAIYWPSSGAPCSCPSQKSKPRLPACSSSPLRSEVIASLPRGSSAPSCWGPCSAGSPRARRGPWRSSAVARSRSTPPPRPTPPLPPPGDGPLRPSRAPRPLRLDRHR